MKKSHTITIDYSNCKRVLHKLLIGKEMEERYKRRLYITPIKKQQKTK